MRTHHGPRLPLILYIKKKITANIETNSTNLQKKIEARQVIYLFIYHFVNFENYQANVGVVWYGIGMVYAVRYALHIYINNDN